MKKPSQPKGYQKRHLQLKIHLLKLGISQRELARRLGVAPNYLNRVLMGYQKGMPLRRRLVAFGLPPSLVELPKEDREEKAA